MENDSQLSCSLGSVSENNPLDRIIDDLYFLKCSLVKNGKTTAESFSNLQQILNLITTQIELRKPLYKWKFLETELLYFFRGPKFNEAINIATLLISSTNSAPELYFTKKFLFFLTDSLFLCLGGSEEPNNSNIRLGSDLNMSLFNDCLEVSDLFTKDQIEDKALEEAQLGKEKESMNEGSFEYDPFNSPRAGKKIDYEPAKLILKLVSELIRINKGVIHILFDLSFFELANECICSEAGEMFNSVFKDISFPYVNQADLCKENWIQDGLYEVRRKHFDPEVIFRDKDVFIPNTVIENLQAGVYDKIYKQCTNLRDFADLSFTSFIDVLLYKKISYSCPDIFLLLSDAKNEKIFRFYRRSLEVGYTPDESLLGVLIKSIDSPNVRKEATLCLYYYIDYINSSKKFTESKIRCIIECLEYHCEHECTRNAIRKLIHKNIESKSILEGSIHPDVANHSFDSNLGSTVIFGNTNENNVYQSPRNLPVHEKARGILENFSEFENSLGPSLANSSVLNQPIFICERERMLCLIKHLYSIVPKEYFYKPSYLILMSFSLAHLPEEEVFITQFYNDFLKFTKKDSRNICKVFLSMNSKEVKSKLRKIKMEDSFSDFYGINNQQDVIEDVKDVDTKFSGIRIVKNMIESDEE